MPEDKNMQKNMQKHETAILKINYDNGKLPKVKNTDGKRKLDARYPHADGAWLKNLAGHNDL